MKKYFLLLVLLTSPCFAQNTDRVGNWDYEKPVYTPFNPKGDKNTYGIKAKLLPYTIGNEFGTYSSIGTEIGFFKNQSVTVEWFFNYKQHSNDEVVDRQGVEHDSGNRDHMNEHALQIGYRYYYGFQKLRGDGITLYNGVFVRAEQDKLYFDPNYDDIPYLNKTAKVRMFGLLTGFTIQFRRVPNLGLDCNASLGRSFTKAEYEKRLDDFYFTEKEEHNSFYFNLGISLNYYF